MVILRLVYASSLPSLEDMVKVGMGENIQMPIKEHNPSQPLNETDSIHSFESLVNLVAKNKEPLIYAYLKADVHLVSFSHGTVEIKLNEGVPKDLPLKLSHLLKQWTGETWSIIASQQEAVSPTLMQQDEAKQQQEIEEIRKDPLVAKALEAFPGAVIESIE